MGLKIALYHNLESGGAKRSNMDRVRRLVRDHTVDLYCPATANLSFCDLSAYTRKTRVFPYQLSPVLGRPFGRANPLIRLWNVWRLEVVQRYIAADIDRGGYDVVLAEPCMVTQAPSLLKYLKTPSVYYCHEPPRGLYEPVISRPYNNVSRIRQALDRVDILATSYRSSLRRIDLENVRAADIVLTDSVYMAGIIKQIYAVQAWVNRPVVDSEHFCPLATGRENFVVSAGALKPEKGFDFVIESLATIPASRRPPLVVISNWEIPAERRYLAHLAEQCGVQVTFRVDVPDAELVRLYNQASLTVYAPVREPLGLVPLESQACETTVVGVGEGGILETIRNEYSGLITQRDPKLFGQAVWRLLANPKLRAEYGRQGRSFVTHEWGWAKSVALLEFALDEASRVGCASAHTH